MADIDNRCCFIPCGKDADYMILLVDDNGVDQSTYSCRDHFSQMRELGELAFDLETGVEVE